MDSRHKRLVRVFFNTYYDRDAEQVLRELERLGEIVVKRSMNVPELYYVELTPRSGGDLEELERAVRSVFERAPASIFGVKVYSVRT